MDTIIKEARLKLIHTDPRLVGGTTILNKATEAELLILDDMRRQQEKTITRLETISSYLYDMRRRIRNR